MLLQLFFPHQTGQVFLLVNYLEPLPFLSQSIQKELLTFICFHYLTKIL